MLDLIRHHGQEISEERDTVHHFAGHLKTFRFLVYQTNNF